MNAEFDFDKMSGLIPAVVQDSGDGEVLMVGFMNREALRAHAREGLRHLLQPHAPAALDERRKFGKPAAGRLRATQTVTATLSCCASKWRGQEWFATAGRGRASPNQFLTGLPETAPDLPGETR